ncbi:1129_t:CDS:2 [Ambispora gerdemannii]|uniref:1129_t:CDS:1 n=1 Tax=Ambispora gerdemannii TaxID=144530 RepID=A0A9N9CST4_9GLOM|nr:1129_t:CDS:2 [Ambispora gerdemannii]
MLYAGDDEDSGTTDNVPSVYLPESHSGSLATGNIGLGFGLTAIAAAACAIGSLAPFLDYLFPFLPFLQNFRITQSKGFLAGSLSLASGILLNLALGDLFPEGVSSLGHSKLFPMKWSRMIATAVFIFTTTLLITAKYFIRKRFGIKHHHQQYSCSCDTNLVDTKESVYNISGDNNEKIDHQNHVVVVDQSNKASCIIHNGHEDKALEAKRLKSLGIQIAVALAIHNFPEGLATFATTIASARIGVVFAIALALHKFPEGLIIALPIYYATGSRWKAFAISATVGVFSQMLGAVFGYVLFVTYWNEAVTGFLFSIVTGILLFTILHSMLPLAHSYDPENRYCTIWTFVGIFFFGIVNSIFDLA